ncbi:flagellar FlbD family protein [Bacillus mexicanus]|uniref:flagellar FlbD family protein n=1 Tax=Bacillus mexicanus TaxID=2834415 RepID=UPI003D1BD316
MIYLTKTDEDKTKILVNHRRVVTIESTISQTSNIFMDNGKIITVVEREEEIIKKIKAFESEIIKKSLKGEFEIEKESRS